MGCWNETCGFSNLPITHNMPVRAMFVKRVQKDRRPDGQLFYAFDLYQPATVLIKSTYNDYGWLNVTAEELRPFIVNIEQMGLDISFEDEKEDFRPKDLPPETYLWMIREDVYQMLRNIPLDHWGDMPKNVGQYVDRMRANYAKLVEDVKATLADPTSRTAELGIWDYDLRSRLDNLFNRTEGPMWPLRHHLAPMAGIDVPPENVDELVDLLQIFAAMNATRKTMVPTIGGGSQDYNEEAYRIIANFTNNAMDEYRKEFDWEDEDEEESEF